MQETRTAAMATIPERTTSLYRVIQDILPQVDKLNIYLNNFKQIPAFCRNPKIETFLSMNHGDFGDAGKFFKVAENKGYYFPIDDDLIYANTYIANLISGIERYKRVAVVSYHGRVMPEQPVRTYYYGHKEVYQCLQKVEQDIDVHIGGTGVMGFHSDTIKLSINDFPVQFKNMADIHMGIACQKAKVPVKLLAHDLGYIKHSESVSFKNTIHYKYHQNDMHQTGLVNKVLKWRFF